MNRIIAWTIGALTFVLVMQVEAKDRGRTASAGAEVFRAYCASCHGAAGKGDGPVAPALKVPPADLTTLARRNGGRFPAVRVFQSVEGSAAFPAHGSREMPVWGTVLRQRSGSSEAQVKLSVRNLTNYIESLQVK